jgi:ankyrin repeat protein
LKNVPNFSAENTIPSTGQIAHGRNLELFTWLWNSKHIPEVTIDLFSEMVKMGQVKIIRFLLGNIDQTQKQLIYKNLGTVLHTAIENKFNEIAKLIIQNCPEDFKNEVLMRTDAYYKPLMHLAIESVNSAILPTIIDAWPDKNKNEYLDITDANERIALHRAAALGDMQAIEILLKAWTGSDIDVFLDKKDNSGCIALHHAGYSNNPRVLNTLLEAYPNGDIVDLFNRTNDFGDTVLHLAAQNRRDVTNILNFMPAAFQNDFVFKKNNCGFNALFVAIKNSNYIAIQPLLFACSDNNSRKALLSNQTNITTDSYLNKSGGKTVLHLAAESFQYNIPSSNPVDALLQAWPDPDKSAFINFIDANGNTALHVSREYNIQALVDACRDKKTKIAYLLKRNLKGNSALHCAVIDGNPARVTALVKAFPIENKLYFIEDKNRDGKSALHAAVGSCYRGEILLALLNSITKPADRKKAILTPSTNGDTPLHYCIPLQCETFVLVLNSFPETDRADLLLRANTQQKTSLDLLIDFDKFDLAFGYLDLLTSAERQKYLSRLLERALYNKNVEHIKKCLNYCQNDTDRLAVCKSVKFTYDRLDLMQPIMDAFNTAEGQVKIFNQMSIYGEQILAVYKHNVSSDIVKILSLCPCESVFAASAHMNPTLLKAWLHFQQQEIIRNLSDIYISYDYTNTINKRNLKKYYAHSSKQIKSKALILTLFNQNPSVESYEALFYVNKLIKDNTNSDLRTKCLQKISVIENNLVAHRLREMVQVIPSAPRLPLSAEEIQAKNDIIKQLQAYIYKTNINGIGVGFYFGFKYFIDHQAKHRKANYDLANRLITKLTQEYPTLTLQEVIDDHIGYRYFSRGYAQVGDNHYINSKPLNDIIRDAKHKIDTLNRAQKCSAKQP